MNRSRNGSAALTLPKQEDSSMRILIVMPLLALGACNVSTDQNNQAVTVQYNQEEAQNTAADISNTAQNVGQEIGNEATTAANAINQKVAGENNSDDSTNTTNQQ
jgi:hypothetical protein